MMIWFTSDQHFGHKNIIGYSGRPFADVTAMNDAMVRRHNARVRADDIVVHLGDFAMDERLVGHTLSLLNGRHFLIPGNHDRCHPCHSHAEAARRRYRYVGFEDVLAIGVRMTLHGIGDVLLTHMPTRGDHSALDRYVEYRPHDTDGEGVRYILHGHVHEAWRKRGREINLGVDAWDFYPVNGMQLASYLRNAPENDTPMEHTKESL